MRVDGCNFAKLHVACLRFRNLQFRNQLVGLNYFSQHSSQLHVLAHLQRQINQYAVDARADTQGIQLLPLQFRQGLHLVDFGLLLGELGFDCLLADLQSLTLQVISGGEFVGLALRGFVGKARNDTQIRGIRLYLVHRPVVAPD